jgi:cyclopropane fatty-acyl-phospholipid synthase-like methyltransferase
MIIPIWKRWLSYLWPISLDCIATEEHDYLLVSLVRGRLQLSTPNAIYSFEDLYVNFAEAFRKIDFSRLPEKNVLVLGLGLGSVIQLLEQEHHLDATYTAVELDEGIIDLAHQFTLCHLNAPVTVVATDGEAFLRSWVGPRFDLIILDIFKDDKIPTYFSSSECLDNIKHLLSPGGLFLSNRLYRTPTDKKKSDTYNNAIYKIKFPNMDSLTIAGNLILINDRAYLKSS